ncbi:MAG TPA: SDR family oxidoreductase [Gaiellaceae bacterium]|nr:SDR family oxidoreductase [Gaiellaceae bacterium]
MSDAVPESWRLDGRVALVTGAQRGIGLACARALRSAGARVGCVDLPGSGLEEAVAGLGPGASAHPADVADVGRAEALVEEVVRRHGRLDILVGAAGTLAPAPFLALTPDDWDRTLAVNARGAVFLAQACARHFVAAGVAGRIVLVASIVGRSVVRPNNTAYSASKAALIQAARCMALELAPHGITVNTVSPGSTATEMLLEVQARGDVESIVRGNAAEWRLGIPLGRLAEPSDQAALVVFLAGDGARHITGQDLAVDGGQTTV